MNSRSIRSSKATDLDFVSLEVFSVGCAGCSGTGAVLQTVDLDGACCASLLDRALYHAGVGCGGLARERLLEWRLPEEGGERAWR